MEIHISTNGDQQGPYDIDQINSSIADGSLNLKDSLAWYEGCEDWISLGDVPGVIPSRPKSPRIPPPPPPPDEINQPVQQFSMETMWNAVDLTKDPTKPDKVKQAVLLLWASIAIGALRVLFDLVTIGGDGDGSIIFVLLFVIVMFAIVALLTVMIDRGKNWSRITVSILFAIGIPSTLIAIVAGFAYAPFDALLGVIQFAAQIFAVVFLWQKESIEWFNTKKCQDSHAKQGVD